RRHRDRLAEAQRGEMSKQALIFRTGAEIGWRQVHRAGRIALEQLAVVPLYDVEMAEQILGKGSTALIAKETRKTLDRFHIVRQRMGLLIGNHLQPVL